MKLNVVNLPVQAPPQPTAAPKSQQVRRTSEAPEARRFERTLEARSKPEKPAGTQAPVKSSEPAKTPQNTAPESRDEAAAPEVSPVVEADPVAPEAPDSAPVIDAAPPVVAPLVAPVVPEQTDQVVMDVQDQGKPEQWCATNTTPEVIELAQTSENVAQGVPVMSATAAQAGAKAAPVDVPPTAGPQVKTVPMENNPTVTVTADQSPPPLPVSESPAPRGERDAQHGSDPWTGRFESMSQRTVAPGGASFEPAPPMAPTLTPVSAPVVSVEQVSHTGPPVATAAVPLSETQALEADPNVARVVRSLGNAVSQNGGALTLRLHPPELGVVRIAMEVSGGTVRAALTAEHESVRTLLQHQISQLRGALEGHGLTVDRLEVQTAPPAHPNGTGPQQDGESDSRSRGGFAQHGQREGQQPGDGSEGHRRSRFHEELLNLVA